MPRNNKDIRVVFAKKTETLEVESKNNETKNYNDLLKYKKNISNAETLEEIKKIYQHIEKIYSILSIIVKS